MNDEVTGKGLVFGRETRIAKPPLDENAETEVFAICLETDDETLLVPMKVYKIEMRGNRVCVTDEEGEAAIYPAEIFLPLALSPAAKNTLAGVVG